MLVLHPKGENRYAPPRRALIAPDGRAFVQDYLDLRAALLRRIGFEDCKGAPLIPMVRGRQVGFYTYNGLTGAKRMVEQRLGLRFTFREYRRAGGQRALDLGAELSAVSRNLGPSTTVTTERHYARVKVDRAFEELERAFAAPKLNSR